MNRCEECGLPIHICNALAMYQKMVKSFERGDMEAAKNYAKYAAEDYADYIERFRTTEPAE